MAIEAEGEPSTGGSKSVSGLRLENALGRHRPPRGLTWRGHLVQLLRTASSIEHALMVQYLFAAYSLGGRQVTDEGERQIITSCQNIILSVAKEEMGHLLTVQNVLCLLGESADLTRDNLPWKFPFKLERLTIDSLDSYLRAEGHAPLIENAWDVFTAWGFVGKDAKNSGAPEIANEPDAPNVADLYRFIIELIGDPDRIRDSDFSGDSFRYQASWDDWGRSHNYQTLTHAAGGLRSPDGLLNLGPIFTDLMANLVRKPLGEDVSTRADVIIERAATRTQAVRALKSIAEQGEAAPLMFEGSHFERFNRVRNQFGHLMYNHKDEKNWEPTHRVANNPHTVSPKETLDTSTITWPRSKKWANLFNLRYCMLLTYLSHSFYLAYDENETRLRGAIIHKAFGEMYNLKAISGILVRLPLTNPANPDRAGPPFQMSYMRVLPDESVGRWRLHRDLLRKALRLNSDLQKQKGRSNLEEISYLRAMDELDRGSAEWIKKVIAGLRHGRTLSS